MHCLFHFTFKQGNNLFLPFFEVLVANVCSNGEPRRHWHTDKVHLSQVGTFTTKQISHVCLTLSNAIAEGVNSFLTH